MKRKNNVDQSRRQFIRNTSLAATGFFIVPRHVLGRGYVAPSDKLRIAGIGVGGKGQSDLSEFAKSPKVSIIALCDVDDRSAAKSRTNFPNAKYYKDFREMLDKEKIILTPAPYQHLIIHTPWQLLQPCNWESMCIRKNL